jgi:DNA-binding response OmpR family regulator
MQKRAIIVDDEPATCELIEKVLTSAGISSLSVKQSSEAADLLRRGKFAVAFLGCHMPFPDGLALTRQMRDSDYNRTTPVILISDDQRPGAMSKGFEAGASFFLYKPVDKDRLQRLVRATHGAMDHEIRRTRRVPLRSRVLIRFCGQEIEGETVDVSMQGLLVRAQRMIPIGSSAEITMELSQAIPPIVGTGSIVRVHGKDQMGIHLGRLALAESQRLQEFLLPLIP